MRHAKEPRGEEDQGRAITLSPWLPSVSVGICFAMSLSYYMLALKLYLYKGFIAVSIFIYI